MGDETSRRRRTGLSAVAAALWALPNIAWFATGGAAVVVTGVIGVVLRAANAFNGPLFATIAVGIALLAVAAVQVIQHATRRVFVAAQTGFVSARQHGTPLDEGPVLVADLHLNVENMRPERPLKFIDAALHGSDLHTAPFFPGSVVPPSDAVASLPREIDCHFRVLLHRRTRKWKYRGRVVLTDQFGYKHRSKRFRLTEGQGDRLLS